MFSVFASQLVQLPFLKVSGEKGAARDAEQFTEDDDLDLCIYYLRTIANVFRWAPDAIWSTLATKAVSSEEFPGLSEISEYTWPGSH